jgi:hypothetical protein
MMILGAGIMATSCGTTRAPRDAALAEAGSEKLRPAIATPRPMRQATKRDRSPADLLSPLRESRLPMRRAGGVAPLSPPSTALASARRILPASGTDHRTGEPSSGSCDQLSAIRDNWVSIGVALRRFDCRTFWADCCAFLSRSRSSFNSEI